MSKNGTAAGVTSALAGGLGLLYFKPAGTIINQDTFLDKLQACPITVEIEHRFEPEFNDMAPIPNLNVETELRLSVAFNLENNDGLLESGSAEVGLFKVNTDPVKSFNLKAAPQEVEPADVDDQSDVIVNFVTTSQVLASSKSSDAIDASKALELLAIKDPATDEALRSDAWFDKLGNEISKYARCTSFILEAGESVIVEPGAEEDAVNPPPAAAAGAPRLRINANDDADTSPSKPLVPSITREQLEQKREDRQGWMDEIRKRFRVANRVVYRVPLSQLADHPEIETLVHELVAQSGEQFDVFLQRNITALVESAVVQIG